MFTLRENIPRNNPLPPHSKPGAFIAQIAAMNRAFARGSMLIVSAKAVNGHTVMLTNSGHWKCVSVNKAIGTTT